MRLRKLIVVLLVFSAICARGQSVSDQFQDKVYAYSIRHPSQTLFVHFDKNIYLSTEDIWFASYMINHSTIKSKVLSIGLVDHSTKRIIKTDQFILLNEFSAGKILIPDSLPSGRYDLICFTDALINNKPVDIFIQPIEIRSLQKKNYSLSVNSQRPEKPNEVLIKATTKELLPADNVKLRYSLILNNTKIEGSGKTDSKGLFAFTVPDSIAQQTIKIVASGRKGGQLQQCSILLNTRKNNRLVHFYPEGGNLIVSNRSRVGVEITNSNGTKQIDTAYLIQNGEIIEKLITDKNGMAILHVTPQYDRKSILRVSDGGLNQDFELPAALHQGVAIQTGSLIAETVLKILVNSTSKGSFSVILHNYREVFGVYAANFTGPATTTIQVPSMVLPYGLFTITVINETGTPVAEKVIYRKPKDSSSIMVTTSKSIFEKNTSVKVSIKSMLQNSGNTVLSVACINQDRLDYAIFKRIDNYSYLYHELNSLVSDANSSTIDTAELDKLVLIKGWSAYKTKTLSETDANDTLAEVQNVIYSGFVKNKLDNKPRKNASVTVLTDSSANIFTTDDHGQFEVTNESLLNNSNSGDIGLVVNNDKQKAYNLTLADPYRELLQKVIDSAYRPDLVVDTTKEENGKTDDFEVETRVLDGVTVRSRSSGTESDYFGYHANACGDWVCRQNTLNCPVHLPTAPGSYKPVKGKSYRTLIVQPDGSGKYLADQIYVGCILEEKSNAMNIFQGIHNLKDYYMPVRSDGINTNSSNLHWESLKQLSPGETYDLEFESGKSAGTFLFVVQGIADNKPVYYEKMITVE